RSRANQSLTPTPTRRSSDLSWVAAVPLNPSPHKTYTPQTIQNKPPSTTGAQSIAIKISGTQCNITLEWPTEQVEQLAQFARMLRSEEHTSELQSRFDLVCRL